MSLKIEIDCEGHLVKVCVAGEIDAYTAPRLREKLLPLAEKKNVVMTVDLSTVSYMDSTGLGVFVGIFKTVRSNKGEFEMVGLSERLQRLFKITGLADIIHITSETKGGVQ